MLNQVTEMHVPNIIIMGSFLSVQFPTTKKSKICDANNIMLWFYKNNAIFIHA